MVDKIDKERMSQNYGFALAFMRSDPELWKLFNQAVRQTWTADRFVAQLRGTDWFKKHSASVRNAIMQETSDPATYRESVRQTFATVRDKYGEMFGTAGMDRKDLMAWAETAKRLGWTDAQLMDHIVKSTNFKKELRNKQLGGAAADYEATLRAFTQAYGVDLGDQWRANQVKALLAGNDTIEGVRARVQELAMREYKAFADAIAGGQTVQDIASPYMQKMADLLELNPADINLKNKLIQQALKQRTPDGKPAAMDLNDFEDAVRQDPRWQYTENARQQVANTVAQLAQAFGAMA